MIPKITIGTDFVVSAFSANISGLIETEEGLAPFSYTAACPFRRRKQLTVKNKTWVFCQRKKGFFRSELGTQSFYLRNSVIEGLTLEFNGMTITSRGVNIARPDKQGWSNVEFCNNGKFSAQKQSSLLLAESRLFTCYCRLRFSLDIQNVDFPWQLAFFLLLARESSSQKFTNS